MGEELEFWEYLLLFLNLIHWLKEINVWDKIMGRK